MNEFIHAMYIIGFSASFQNRTKLDFKSWVANYLICKMAYNFMISTLSRELVEHLKGDRVLH